MNVALCRTMHAAAIVFSRNGELWAAEPLAGPDATLHMPELGISVPLSEIYADVALVADEAETG